MTRFNIIQFPAARARELKPLAEAHRLADTFVRIEAVLESEPDDGGPGAA